jgi:hypothetical protein
MACLVYVMRRGGRAAPLLAGRPHSLEVDCRWNQGRVACGKLASHLLATPAAPASRQDARYPRDQIPPPANPLVMAVFA